MAGLWDAMAGLFGGGDPLDSEVEQKLRKARTWEEARLVLEEARDAASDDFERQLGRAEKLREAIIGQAGDDPAAVAQMRSSKRELDALVEVTCPFTLSRLRNAHRVLAHADFIICKRDTPSKEDIEKVCRHFSALVDAEGGTSAATGEIRPPDMGLDRSAPPSREDILRDLL